MTALRVLAGQMQGATTEPALSLPARKCRKPQGLRPTKAYKEYRYAEEERRSRWPATTATYRETHGWDYLLRI
ncbi:MAG: hypothetical protein HYT88_02310 [Candidatus Omnitrophica bacterium]|nr:hypothetical protein [Candidatus Omnitrophota bacterium]MBI2174988.1 hypothetical protein [Candidatus Omnitrophota bacterium]